LLGQVISVKVRFCQVSSVEVLLCRLSKVQVILGYARLDQVSA